MIRAQKPSRPTLFKVTTQFKYDNDVGHAVYFVWAGSEADAQDVVAKHAHRFKFLETQKVE